MQCPDFLKQFQKQAEDYLAKGCVKDIEFSGGTYQIQVVDPKSKESVWAFIQLDNRGHIKDSFCCCEDSENVNACIHVAVAYLRIYLNQTSPLHQRFERSIWNKLCRLYSDRMGSDTSLLKLQDKKKFT